MADRVLASLVVSNVALVTALVALIVAVVMPGPQGPPGPSPSEPLAPPMVGLRAEPCPVLPNCWRVVVTSVSNELPLWRFSVTLLAGAAMFIVPPVMLMQTGNLWISPYGDNLYLNFTDGDFNGNLTVGDSLVLENAQSLRFYSVRLLWSGTGTQIQHATFRN